LTEESSVDDTRIVGGTRAGSGRWTLAALVLASCLLALHFLCWRVQVRIWNYLSWIDLAVMTALIAPFVISKWALPPRSRWTHVAWWICALMALDVLAFAVGELSPTGGHPSLEALFSLWLGVAKVALVPAALLGLVVAAFRGERVATIALGTLCVIGETLYTVLNPDQPLGWFAWLPRSPA
jgi:hypothetical protein